ncbi:MAG: hypothetical protein N3E41_08800 [Thermofilaceae archaeon]|nr:hypothetical protein [Thermofilaceae archaeon]
MSIPSSTASSFQFFPSCCGETRFLIEAKNFNFQFFPSCCREEVESILGKLRLSILSQLLYHTVSVVRSQS